jgi:trimeric autotransporter adhesin
MKPTLRALKKISPFVFLAVLFCCIGVFSYAQNIDFGKSYINVTKGLNGGTVEPGDTLEIRASFVVRSGTYDSCGYTDAIPGGTAYIPGTVRVLTNEGKIYKQFTDAVNDDCGWRTGATIRINLGYNPAALPATAARRGRVANTHKPSFYNSACIMIASFRVRVTGVLGNNISTGGGTMTYKSGTNPIVTFTFPANIVRVYQNFAICPNTIGVNAIGTETNGTFNSGRPRNRGTSANVPAGYTYRIFDSGTPNDYSYGIANNTSARFGYTTVNTWAKPDPDPDGAGPLTTHRVFGVWDVIGDHTGAASPTLGNPPADTVVNANAGYMLVVNAAYRIDSAFQQTISNLCPNTYYEISCWMRNICSKCGCDSNGKGATNTSGPIFYIPTATGDSSGVYPNITFDIDGVDYYSTGNLLYSGQWVKKGFTFLTGPAQTSFTLKFFNNAPGGGGNDWALDDISVATCSPNMKYSPSINPNVCRGNPLTLYDTVRSFFNNYTFYKWQRSTDNGATWIDVTAPSGPAVPFWNGTAWEYVTTYTVPPIHTQFTDSADQYRMVVATTLSNLSNANCRFTDVGNIITIHIIDCGPPLGIQMMSFAGRLENGNAMLNWSTGRESQSVFYDIERSTDGSSFIWVGTVNSNSNPTSELNTYSYTDQAPSGVIYYRLKVRNPADQFGYSRTIQLSSRPSVFSIASVINPFTEQLRFDVTAVRPGRAYAELVDAAGQVRRKSSLELLQGINRLSFANTTDLPPGIYILRIQLDGAVLQKTVLKKNN